MKYIFAVLLLASSAFAEELPPADVVKLAKRTVDILSSISIQGKDSILLSEALQSIAAIHNDALAKSQKESPKEIKKEE